MRLMLGLTALCLLAVLATASVAQDDALGTPNLKSPNALAKNDFRTTIDWRYWDGSNDTFTGTAEYGLLNKLTIGAGYVDFDNAGVPPILGAVRASDLSGPAVWAKWVGRPVDPTIPQWGWSIVPGVEILDMQGTNTAIGASAGDTETVFTLEVPIGIPDGSVLWMIDPKLAVFPGTAPVTGPIGIGLPASVDSFGTVVGLGLGVTAPLGPGKNWKVYGDVTPILCGDNAIDNTTNTPTIQLPWTLGVRRHVNLASNSCVVDAFLTNCSGGTTATSLIATPDGSVGYGVRASVTW
ncbi:MAG: hypothetical protein FJX75_18300 [Armatimonadetes bacterium]|nr:hypothetical protein [Armatimonadota bacterium]